MARVQLNERLLGVDHVVVLSECSRRRLDVIHAMLRSGLTYGELPGPAKPAPEPEVALAAQTPLTNP
jgi:hypothetical protein